MKLKRLNITRGWQGNLEGKLEVEGDVGAVALNLTEELCQRILVACADSIVSTAKQVAMDLTREALAVEHVPTIATRPEEQP